MRYNSKLGSKVFGLLAECCVFRSQLGARRSNPNAF